MQVIKQQHKTWHKSICSVIMLRVNETNELWLSQDIKFMVSIMSWYRLIHQGSHKPRKDSSLWSYPKLDYKKKKKINVRYLNYCQGKQWWFAAMDKSHHFFCILHSKPCCVPEPKPFNLSWQNWLGSVLIFLNQFLVRMILEVSYCIISIYPLNTKV